MSEELARLRADLEVFERHGLIAEASFLKDKIAKLEAEAADPWREAKEAADLHIVSGGHRVKEVARWAMHLQAENDHLTAERDRLAARVAELEADSFRRQSVIKRADELCVKDVIVDGGMIRTITEITFAEDQYKVFCGGWVRWCDKDSSVAVVPRPFAVAKPDPDDPILDPARVLATACELLHQLGGHWQAADARAVWRYSDLQFSAKPYRLKGGDGD